ncbi:hypothetical protein BCR34DRAFT_621800 [Clohesyomyces aquaticus]|uniref:L-ornithine N(5)-oxygenase n=1 Tax=Clohesyomyces aquaticus TaxID=1231657 RepID=A0A1Y2A5L1_9PLEO|nr:hypothetical protein BCR34DRAFT_621800 [Clohesyomyces aquaticus]
MDVKKFDLVIIGAGRIYPNFWTQWTVGLSELSDMPLHRPSETDCHYEFCKADYTAGYLEKYVDRRGHDSRTLRDRIRLDSHVKSRQNLIVASGTTSSPNMPKFSGKHLFGGPILHSVDFGASDILQCNSSKQIIVIGAGKSSADMVYEAVKTGNEVSWIIRSNGTGAAFFPEDKGRGPYKNAFEAASTRFLALLNPSIYNEQNIWNKFLQNTYLGNWFLRCLITATDNGIRKVADYKGRKSSKGFEKLEYDTP